MKKKAKFNAFWAGVPPWLFIGAAVVLLPIFIVLAVENIHRQQQNYTRLLVDKGAALIRAFEAGTRTGMMGSGWGNFKLQRLLFETAQQPDIDYLLVVNVDGTILAHSDPSRIGGSYGRDLDLAAVAGAENVRWRRVVGPAGNQVLEVFRRFKPTGPGGNMRRGMMMHRPQSMLGEFSEADVLKPQIIFVGLDMTSIEAAGRADAQHTVFMAAIMLLVGFAGIILLFLAQGYRSARASLSRIKAFSDTLVDNMPIGLVALDAAGRVASLNNVARSVLGLSDPDTVGKAARTALPGELAGQILEVIPAQGTAEREIECRLPDGKTIPLAVSISRLAEGGHVVLIKDQREVRSLQKEIARSQRLVAVGRLAGGVAHEVRNPLSSIKGFATYFKERYRDVPEDQQIADIMIKEVDRLNRVIGQLLEFARPVTIQKSSKTVSEILEDSLRLVAPQADEKKIRIDIRIEDGIEPIELDPDKIQQVLLNLYLNAIEAMDTDGTLTVSAAPDRGRDGVEIRVNDTGIGIGVDALPHVFDPYFTTKTTGTGLGLAIAHNILEAHGGEIRIESRPGEGTVAVLSLPYRNERTDETP